MKITAIVIKRVPTNEYDQIVHLYTKEHGKMQAIAKSSLKANSKQAMHLGEGNLIECELISGNGYPIITGAQALSCFLSIRSSLPKTAVMFFFLEVLDKVVFDHEHDRELWEFLFNSLNKLSEDDSPTLNFFRSSQEELLNVLGYAGVEKEKKNGRSSLDFFLERLAQKHIYSLDFLFRVCPKS